LRVGGGNPPNLGTAADYVILAKTGITNVPSSAITGDIAVSPAAAAAITGFSLILDSNGESSTSTQVEGNAYAADYASPTPAKLTTAVLDMQAAYTDVAGRTNPDFEELGAGLIGGMTLTPGLHMFTTDVYIGSDITFDGGADEIFIIQIAGNLIQATGKSVILKGGAKAENIFWQVGGSVTVMAGAHMEGIILVKNQATFLTGSSLNGLILSQTACVLQMATIVQPESMRIISNL
jgi:hypothetical protein